MSCLCMIDLYVCISVCLFQCRYDCTYVCMYVREYVCVGYICITHNYNYTGFHACAYAQYMHFCIQVFQLPYPSPMGTSRVVVSIWCVGAGEPSARPVRDANSGNYLMLTSPSFARYRQC